MKGIVSRDFRGLQMILMKRARVPGISLDVNFFIFIYVDQIKNCCGNTGGKDNSSLAISLVTDS